MDHFIQIKCSLDGSVSVFGYLFKRRDQVILPDCLCSLHSFVSLPAFHAVLFLVFLCAHLRRSVKSGESASF